MRRLIKVAILASIFLIIAYLANSGDVAGQKKSKAAPQRPVRKLTTAAPPEIPLPANFQSPCAKAQEHTLPLPSTVPPAEFVTFEKRVLAFLQNGDYKQLGWCQDKGVRDTGPFSKGVYYGTHPAVRIFYSPEAMKWLIKGRQGELPDGAMIIKEQYPPPASRYAGMADNQLPRVIDWTIMIKDARGAKDGWFWGEFFDGMNFDDDGPSFSYPWAGFGLYCLRCHATAEKELTFSALRNINGFPGQPIVFPNDGSWRPTPPPNPPIMPLTPGRQANPDFLRTFTAIPGVPFDAVQKMPSETYDHVAAPGVGPAQFISSSQCMSCHGALNAPFGPVMFLPAAGVKPGTPVGANVSPYGEWRWSPMGLAGRDPIFFAQLESELAYVQTLPPPQNEQMATLLKNGCLACHGMMGKRQLDIDTNGTGNFQLEFLQLTDRSNPNFKYGALARDGISCLSCHRNAPTPTPPGQNPLEYFLENSITGKFQLAPADQVYGPFQDNEIAPYAMETGLGIKPQFNAYLSSSRMCGSCHTINLPVADGTPSLHSIEQSTYLEWLNSQYQDEFGKRGAQTKSCQDCHMPGSFHSKKEGINVPQIRAKIAIIEDETYPDADHRVPENQITVRQRNNYQRHEFLGLNVFLLAMFNQFADVLGVRKDDYMSGSTTDLQDTIDNFGQQAQERTARVAVTAAATSASALRANVTITNLAGHRFPSGVGFRRVFIELLVKDAQGQVVWASGRTNNLGLIVDGNGQVLPSEFFSDYIDQQGRKQQHYQPHRQLVTAQDQVQIYEELIKDAAGRFTTSFIRRDETFKDNRLLPFGWTEAGPNPSLNGRFLKATHPDGTGDDPDYKDGRAGQDRITYQITLPAGVDARRCTVEATLYHQSIPPSYLNERFRTAPNGTATQRLYYLTSTLNLQGTVIENWKLQITNRARTAVVSPRRNATRGGARSRVS